MNYDEIDMLRKHPGWRLLRADNAPLILSFLDQVFVEDNVRSIAATDLASRLDDVLYALNERLGERTFPKSAQVYLDDWAAAEAGWLRKYYPEGSDEPHFDATPAVEKSLNWVKSLVERSFVGTESRLNTIFELLRQMTYGAQTDQEIRLAELRQRRQQIDEEIAVAEEGRFDVMDPTAQRERYQQFAATARELLADFREVEANFRALDRALREQISGWRGSKGELLDEVLGNRDSIADSDQGRTFRAFYDFLLSHARQEELSDLLDQVHRLDAVAADPRMRKIHYDWLDAGERTQATVRQLSEQLRRFLDDQVWFENRRVMEILRSIEGHALKVREHPPAGLAMELAAPAPDIALPMERPLYSPLTKSPIDSESVQPGDGEFDAGTLFEQIYVDPARLAEGVRRELRRRPQIGLAELVRQRPLEQGLAELVTYLSLRDESFRVVFDDQAREQVTWSDPDGSDRVATVPRVTFARTTTVGGTR